MSPTPLFPGGLTNSIPKLSSFPPHRDKNCRKFKSVKFNSKGVIGEFWHVPRTLLTKDYQSLENKDYKNGKLKRTVSRDFLLLFFAWFSPIWTPYLYNKVHYMINMVSISKCKTLTHNYSITFKGFFSSMYKAAVSWHFGHSFFQD